MSLKDPDLSLFIEEELQVLDAVFDTIISDHTAASISEQTHDDVWKLAQDGEVIPPNAIFASQLGRVTDSDLAWARERLHASRNAA